MQFWNEIIHTALLGTERKQLPVDSLPPALKEAAGFVTAQPDTDREEQFLQVAAATSNFRRSGVNPLHEQAKPVTKAPPESLPYCSPRAAQILKDILAEDNPNLLACWLDCCNNAQQLAQPELVPILLSRGLNDRERIREGVTAVCGKRGEWLSGLNPAWASAAPVNEEELWQTGTLDQRRLSLWRVRQQDPAKTRDWLEQTWPQENVISKAGLLKQLDGMVEPEDEPWLTTLLQEKSQKVKDESLTLLQQLPTSALVSHYEELLKPLIYLKKEKALLGMVNKTVVHIDMPVVPDKGDYAQGIEKLSIDKVITDGEYILQQLIEHVPLTFWEQHFGMSLSDTLDQFTGKNLKYKPAFPKAIIQFKDKKSATAYIQYSDTFHPELIDLLPPDQQDAYCLRHFKHNSNLVIEAIRKWTQEWSPDLAKAVIDHTAKQVYLYNISFYKTTIHLIPVAIQTSLDSMGPTDPQHQIYWTNLLEQLKKLLDLKAQTLKAFNE
jgi:hypothetical protein